MLRNLLNCDDAVPDRAQIVSLSLMETMRKRSYTYGHCMRVARNAKLLPKLPGTGCLRTEDY